MKQALPPTVAVSGRPRVSAPMGFEAAHSDPRFMDDAPPPSLLHTRLGHTVEQSPAKIGSPAEPGASLRTRRVTDRAVQVQIVEDLPRVQQLLRQLVEQPGRFEVTGIDDTEQEAFQRSQAQPPDALVVDLNLRQGSGLGLIHAVRKLYGASPTGPLIIVVTNHTMPVLEAACLKAGADHFLDKSRELPRLSALLGQAFFP